MIYYKMNKKEILSELVKANNKRIQKTMQRYNINYTDALLLWMKKHKKKIDNYLLIHSDIILTQ